MSTFRSRSGSLNLILDFKMGLFPRVLFVLAFFLISVGTINCVGNRNRSAPTIFPETRKIKRDSFSPTYSYSSPTFDSVGSFGYQNKFQGAYPARGSGLMENLLSIPSGTKLKFTPEITIPIIGDGNVFPLPNAELESSIMASFPISLTFKEINRRDLFHFIDSLQHKIDPWDSQTSFVNHKVESNEINQPERLLSRKLRNVDSAEKGNRTTRKFGDMYEIPRENIQHSVFPRGSSRCPTKSFSDRSIIFKKMEVFVGSFMESRQSDPKACLLRWACEIHENAGIAGYFGLLGEGALLAFSVVDLARGCDKGGPQLKNLVPFIKAEIAGKSGKCFEYAKKCSQSLLKKQYDSR